MKHRRLGCQGLEVAEQALGCMSMSEYYGTADEAEAVATIERAVGLGVTLFDTSDSYGHGHNEELVGRALKPHRDRVCISTKFGLVRVPGADGSQTRFRGDPAFVRESCEASLQRLGTDCIDLYYQHRTDPDVPVEETVGAMAELVVEGKVRYLGLSEASADVLRRAHAVYPISALQTEWSLFSRDCEADVVPALRELGVGFVAYGALSRGMLTGTVRSLDDLEDGDYRRVLPRFLPGTLEHNLAVADRVHEIAEAKGATPGQIALAWVAAQGGDVVTLPGTKRRKYLEENVASTAVELDLGDLARLDELFPSGSARGDRYRNMERVF